MISIKNYQLLGSLLSSSNKKIECKVQISISVLDDDVYNEQEITNSNEYIDGLRLIGELSFLDGNPPSHSFSNNQSKLKVYYEDEPLLLSEFNIILLQKTGSSECIKNDTRRYFWQFTNLGTPICDGLSLFPPNYSGANKKRFFLVSYVYDNINKGYGIVATNKSWEIRKTISKSISPVKLNHFSVLHEITTESHTDSFISLPIGVTGNGS